MSSRSSGFQETVLLHNGHVFLSPSVLEHSGLKNGDVLSLSVDPDGVLTLRHAAAGAEESASVDEKGRPVPPTWMLQAVVGNSDPRAFAASGDDAARALANALVEQGFDVGRFERVLDFGCGVGRILRSMQDVTRAALHGCDAKPEFVDWCARHLGFAAVVSNGEYPPLPYEDEYFDLVYAISVVTHLDEAHQDRWLEEWKRILKPSGALVVSFKGGTGEAYGESPSEECRRAVAANRGLYFMKTGYWNGVFPDFYETTYHAFDYVRSRWGRLFEIVKIYDVGALAMPQDVAVLRKTSAA